MVISFGNVISQAYCNCSPMYSQGLVVGMMYGASAVLGLLILVYICFIKPKIKNGVIDLNKDRDDELHE